MTKKTTKNLPVKAKSTELITVNQEKISPLDITQKLHHLKSRADVRKYLPDILGRVLARVWIDTGFKEEFAKELIDKSPDLAEEISGLIKYKLFENTMGEKNGEIYGKM